MHAKASSEVSSSDTKNFIICLKSRGVEKTKLDERVCVKSGFFVVPREVTLVTAATPVVDNASISLVIFEGSAGISFPGLASVRLSSDKLDIVEDLNDKSKIQTFD